MKGCNGKCNALKAALVCYVLAFLLLASLAFAGDARGHHAMPGESVRASLVYAVDFKLVGGVALIAWFAWLSRAPRK